LFSCPLSSGRAGLGRKFADLIQYFTQLVASYAVGFYLSWKLTVVLIASFPVIAGAGAFMINAVTAAQVTPPNTTIVTLSSLLSPPSCFNHLHS